MQAVVQYNSCLNIPGSDELIFLACFVEGRSEEEAQMAVDAFEDRLAEIMHHAVTMPVPLEGLLEAWKPAKMVLIVPSHTWTTALWVPEQATENDMADVHNFLVNPPPLVL